MNSVVLMGRLTKDPEVRYTAGVNSQAMARYSLAVDRRTREKATDFISCVAFGKSAEFAEKYLHKGIKILVAGRIQTGSYTNSEGQKVYTTDVVVNEHEFCESRQNAPESPQSAPEPQAYKQTSFATSTAQGFMEVADEGLPWT